jgi:hypothetical protein
MGQKIKVGEVEYEIENLSTKAKAELSSLQFVIKRIEELKKMQFLLQQTKENYINTLKQEMIAQKSGLVLGDD